MMMMRSQSIVLVILAAAALLLSIKPHEATSRALREEEKEEWMKMKNLLLQSLQKGPIPPHAPNPGFPGYLNGNKARTVGQKGFAGNAAMAPPPPPPLCPPQLMAPFPKVNPK